MEFFWAWHYSNMSLELQNKGKIGNHFTPATHHLYERETERSATQWNFVSTVRRETLPRNHQRLWKGRKNKGRKWVTKKTLFIIFHQEFCHVESKLAIISQLGWEEKLRIAGLRRSIGAGLVKSSALRDMHLIARRLIHLKRIIWLKAESLYKQLLLRKMKFSSLLNSMMNPANLELHYVKTHIYHHVELRNKRDQMYLHYVPLINRGWNLNQQKSSRRTASYVIWCRMKMRRCSWTSWTSGWKWINPWLTITSIQVTIHIWAVAKSAEKAPSKCIDRLCSLAAGRWNDNNFCFFFSLLLSYKMWPEYI